MELRITQDCNQRGVGLTELIIVIAVSLIVGAIAVPSFISTRRDYRVLGDAHDLAAEILLAKMRAASDFTQARAYFDLSSQQFRIELWNKTTNRWVLDAPAGTSSLASDITFGYGAQTNPPPNTQTSLGQAPRCVTGWGTNPGGGSDIEHTACVVFNSRGIPIDRTGAATANDAMYITDGSGVYGVTVSATGFIQTWRIGVNDTNQSDWQQR